MTLIMSQDGTTAVNWDDVKCIKGQRMKTGGKQYWEVYAYFRSGEKTSIGKYDEMDACVAALDALRDASEAGDASYGLPEDSHEV